VGNSEGKKIERKRTSFPFPLSVNIYMLFFLKPSFGL